jgi:hypothetical protein
MNATTLIQTLILTEYCSTKLETATNILERLNKMKKIKGMPFFAIRRAIKIQRNIINNLKN